MPPARWFFGIVAACLLALTAGVLARLRYETLDNNQALVFRDTWTGRICHAEAADRFSCVEGP